MVTQQAKTGWVVSKPGYDNSRCRIGKQVHDNHHLQRGWLDKQLLTSSRWRSAHKHVVRWNINNCCSAAPE
jgi:hypothetical protein